MRKLYVEGEKAAKRPNVDNSAYGLSSIILHLVIKSIRLDY